MRIKLLVLVAVLAIATPASAHFPSKCASELNFLAVDGATTQKWKSENVSAATRELLAKTDSVRMKSWIAQVDANQQYIARTMLVALTSLLKCIATNAE